MICKLSVIFEGFSEIGGFMYFSLFGERKVPKEHHLRKVPTVLSLRILSPTVRRHFASQNGNRAVKSPCSEVPRCQWSTDHLGTPPVQPKVNPQVYAMSITPSVANIIQPFDFQRNSLHPPSICFFEIYTPLACAPASTPAHRNRRAQGPRRCDPRRGAESREPPRRSCGVRSPW